MKNSSKLLFTILFILTVSFQFSAQPNGTGKPYYTEEELKKMCDVPVDPANLPIYKAKQDSMYKDYLAKKKGKFGKITTTPNWQPFMSPVDFQGINGNCGVFAATGATEGQLQILYGSVIGSGIDLDESERTTPSFPSWVLNANLQDYKMGSEIGTYPNLAGAKWSILNYTTRVNGITEIQSRLENGPVTAVFSIYNDFSTFFRYNRTGVYRVTPNSVYLDESHAVVIVSYNDDEEYWLCKNSWGTSWGDNGYFRIGYAQCYIENIENCAITAVDQSCYAKMVPNLQTFQSAINSTFIPNEFAYLFNSQTIPANETWNFDPGITLKFASGVCLIVNGTLNAVGTQSQPITFTSISGTSPNSWGTITLNGVPESNLSYLNVQYGNRIEVVNNSSNVEVTHCSITNCYDGIYFNNSSGVVNNNTITSSGIGHGIVFENGSSASLCNQNTVTKGNLEGVGILFGGGSGGTIWQNDVYGWDWGVGAIWGSSPDFSYLGNSGRNNRIRECDIGVRGYQGSYPVICPGGYSSTYYSGNSIYENGYNVYYSTGDQLEAEYTFWNGTPNSNMFMLQSGSTIDYSNYLSNDPWAGMGKAGTGGDIELASNSASNNAIVNTPSSEKDALYNGIQLRLEKKHKQALDFFISYLTKYPDNQAAYVELYYCYSNETADDLLKYFSSLPKEAAKEHTLLLPYLYLKQGNVKEAKKGNSDIIKKNPDTPLSLRAYLNNIYIALYNENNLDEAIMLFNDASEKSELTTSLEMSLVRESIENYANSLNKGADIFFPREESSKIEPNNFVLSNNFPNPFNPTTTITYILPEECLVTLKVYDILGREITTLLNEVKQAGKYTATFDASNLASGIYFYTITAGKYIQTNKMILTK